MANAHVSEELPASADAADFTLADKVLVEKGKRQLHLLTIGIPFRTFKITQASSAGIAAPLSKCPTS